MSFLNFGKDKGGLDHLDTTEIKRAAISDTQLNSINDNPQIEVSQPEQLKQPQQNFVNPFTSQNNESNSQMPTSSVVNEIDDIQNSQFNSTLNTNSQESLLSESLDNSNTQISPQKPSLSQNDLVQSLQNSKETMSKEEIKELIDETVEKVIEEKWDALVDKVDRVLKWKEKKEEEINMLKEDIVNIADGFSKLENKLVSKITNYDKNILDVNSEIKALEKVFQKVTPTLINNVNELSKIADDFKGIKKQQDKLEKKSE